MQRALSVDQAVRMTDGYSVAGHAPERQDDLAFFAGLWAIVPIALGGWALIVVAAMQVFG